MNCGKCNKPKGKDDGCCKCGRPLKFSSVEELQEKVDSYFKDCDPHIEEVTSFVEDDYGLPTEVSKTIITKQKPYTVTGLAVWLDTTRETLLDYEEKDEFSDTIKKAKQRIQAFAEGCLYDKEYPTRGVIFSVSNNFKGWKERKEQDINVPGDGARKLADAMMGEEKTE